MVSTGFRRLGMGLEEPLKVGKVSGLTCLVVAKMLKEKGKLRLGLHRGLRPLLVGLFGFRVAC